MNLHDEVVLSVKFTVGNLLQDGRQRAGRQIDIGVCVFGSGDARRGDTGRILTSRDDARGVEGCAQVEGVQCNKGDKKE